MSRRAVLGAAAAAVVLMVAACGGGSSSQPRQGVNVEQLPGGRTGTFDIDSARVGSRVSLQARVASVLGRRAFTTSGADSATGQPVLVLDNAGVPVRPGQAVQVAGTVQVLLDDGTAMKYGLGPLSQYPQFDHKLVIVADLVDTSTG